MEEQWPTNSAINFRFLCRRTMQQEARETPGESQAQSQAQSHPEAAAAPPANREDA